jgi:hypothetical protein
MVDVLNRCGMSYTFLAAEQVRNAGLEGESLFGPCLTEDQGKLLTVFPLFCIPPSHDLSFTSTSSPGTVLTGVKQEALFDELKRLADSGNAASGEGRIVSICSNGILDESSGIQETGKTINRFFEELSRCEAFAGFTTPGKVLKDQRVCKKAYFGADSKDCVKRFLLDYPEANGIYAKTIFTHVLVNQLRGDKARKTAALEELWKAQGYDAFYRSWSGGFYRGAIRNAVYRSLILAEKTARIKGIFIPSLVNFDFDFDGEDEYIFRNDHISVYVKKQGAAIFEFDSIPQSWNYLNTLLPRETGVRKSGAALNPIERRMAFTDILALPGSSPVVFVEAGISVAVCSARDAGKAGQIRFCGLEPYEVLETDKARQKAGFRLNAVEAPVSTLNSIEINKTYHLKKDSLLVQYKLVNQGKKKADFDFIPRIDLVFPGTGEEYLRVYGVGPEGKDALASGGGDLPGVKTVELDDLENELIITLSCDKTFDAHFAPVYASCPVYGKEQRLYQSTCVLPVTHLSLESAASWSAEYTLKLAY